jgi:hypothetical protein
MCECVNGACKHHLEGHAETRNMSSCSGLTLPPPQNIQHHASCPADMLGCSDFSGHCVMMPQHYPTLHYPTLPYPTLHKASTKSIGCHTDCSASHTWGVVA